VALEAVLVEWDAASLHSLLGVNRLLADAALLTATLKHTQSHNGLKKIVIMQYTAV
jgi:hypothetical protein